PDVQVLMITGEPTAETAAEAVRLGAFDYLSKPIARIDFKSAVTSALRVSELAIERSRLEEENTRYHEHLEEEVAKKTGALRASEEKYRTVLDNASEAVFIIQGGVIPFANPSTSHIGGRSTEDLRTTPFIEWIHPDEREVAIERYTRRMKGEDVSPSYEYRIMKPDGEIGTLELKSVLISWEGKPATLNFASDITDRKARETREIVRQESRQRSNEALLQLATQHVLYEGDIEPVFRVITETAAKILEVEQAAIWLNDESSGMFQCVDMYVQTEGLHRPGRDYHKFDLPQYLDALNKNRVLNVSDLQNDPRMAEFDLPSMAAEGIVSVLDVAIRSAGQLVGDVCFEHAGELRKWTPEEEEFAGEIASLVTLTIELAQRRKAEQALDRQGKEYRALFDDSPAALWYEDFSQIKNLLDELRISGVTDLRSYLHDHPELVEECISKVRIVDVNMATLVLHEAGSKEELLKGLDRILTKSSRESFREQLITIWNGERFYEDTTIDQTINGVERHVAIRWSIPPGYEQTLERVLLAKTDITSTIEAEESLQQALDGTIRAIGMTTEIRDPYTAGHQRRVTELAVAIAQKMQLDPEVIEGARVAGLMHDIGKLAIPAEILSKPSALNAMEFSLIQSHPQAAYDILKTIVFPWPIAQIVLQHHERIDGSGYPNGLHADDIRMEARILAVADTVEAMASHRPYRPALGIDRALEEIEKGRGSKFDSTIADACLELFRHGDFAFSDRND
ncbi:PAS domain S-box protein, partial [Candidatus Bipolaricaulota bacterium]|nr:PAS domain S-box protein [Candidatus Bipolaricaulota bacterium]